LNLEPFLSLLTSNEVGITSLLIGCRHAAYWRFLLIFQSLFDLSPGIPQGNGTIKNQFLAGRI